MSNLRYAPVGVLHGTNRAYAPSCFRTLWVGYAFIGDNRCAEVRMFVNGANLLGFTKEGTHYTTHWLYLEDLVARIDLN